ncbi:MAG: hypothetical protein K9J17_02295 [Flavobacteriales bacterium]|nr:hypothetical protein [Flavobacteriales bacterium]
MKNTFLFSLLVLLVLTGCYRETDYDYTAKAIFGELDVTLSADSILADGKSASIVTYRFPIDADTNLTKLSLKCSNCTFEKSGSDVLHTNVSMLTDSLDACYISVTMISTSSVKDNVLTTELSVYERTDTVFYKQAYPTGIDLTVSPFYLKNDTVAEITLTAEMETANGGVPSKYHAVMFEVSANTSVPGFLQAVERSSNAEGKAINTFVFTGVNSYAGEIDFIARTLDQAGDTIESKQVKLVVIN